MKPQPVEALQEWIFDGSTAKSLPSTTTFCVFHRQSSKNGCFLIFDFVAHAETVATDGLTRVPTPVLVLAGDPANRSAFSQATTPDQLSMNTFPETRSASLYGPFDPGVAARLGEVDRGGRESGLVGPLTSAFRTNVLFTISRVVAGLVHDALGVVARDVVALEAEADIVGVRPQADSFVVVDVVVGDLRAVGLPELAAAGAAAAWLPLLPVIGVVAGDLVAVQDHVLDAVGVVGVEPVLSVVAQAVPDQPAVPSRA